MNIMVCNTKAVCLNPPFLTNDISMICYCIIKFNKHFNKHLNNVFAINIAAFLRYVKAKKK